MKLLNSSNIKYLLIGGYAVNYYGFARATADLDIWIAADRANEGPAPGNHCDRTRAIAVLRRRGGWAGSPTPNSGAINSFDIHVLF